MFKSKKYTIEGFIGICNEVLPELEKERQAILNKEAGHGSWGSVVSIAIPEISKLLSYALKGEVYHKYGEKQKMLETTWFMTDSGDNLYSTELGKKISILQDYYRKL